MIMHRMFVVLRWRRQDRMMMSQMVRFRSISTTTTRRRTKSHCWSLVQQQLNNKNNSNHKHKNNQKFGGGQSSRNMSNNNQDLSYWNRWMTFKNRLLTSKPGSLLLLSEKPTTTTTTTTTIDGTNNNNKKKQQEEKEIMIKTSIDWREAKELITILKRHVNTNNDNHHHHHTTVTTTPPPTTTIERLEMIFHVLDRLCLELEYYKDEIQIIIQQQHEQEQQPTTKKERIIQSKNHHSFCLDGGILGSILVLWRDFIISSLSSSSSSSSLSIRKTDDDHPMIQFIIPTTTTTTNNNTGSDLDPIILWKRLERYHHFGLFQLRPPAYAILLHVMSKILQQQSSSSLTLVSQQQQQQQTEVLLLLRTLENSYIDCSQNIYQTLLQRSNSNPYNCIYHPTSSIVYGMISILSNCIYNPLLLHHHHQQQQQQQQEQQQKSYKQIQQLIMKLQHWYKQTKRIDLQPTSNLYCILIDIYIQQQQNNNSSTHNINHNKNKNKKNDSFDFDKHNNNNNNNNNNIPNHRNFIDSSNIYNDETIMFQQIVHIYKEMQQQCSDWSSGIITSRICNSLATFCKLTTTTSSNNNNNNNSMYTSSSTNKITAQEQKKAAANWSNDLFLQQCRKYENNQYHIYYKPDPHTLTSVLTAYGRTGQIQKATQLFHYIDHWSEQEPQQQKHQHHDDNEYDEDNNNYNTMKEEIYEKNHYESQSNNNTTTKTIQQQQKQQQKQEEEYRRYATQCRKALKPDFVSCSALIWVYAKVGDIKNAEKILYRMIQTLEHGDNQDNSTNDYNNSNNKKKSLWDSQVWNGILTAWATSGNPMASKYILKVIERLQNIQQKQQQQEQQQQSTFSHNNNNNQNNNIVDVSMYNKLLGCYANQKMANEAEQLFQWMEESYHSSSNNGTTGNNGDSSSSSSSSMKPNAESYLSLILAWNKVGNPERCEWYLWKYCNDILGIIQLCEVQDKSQEQQQQQSSQQQVQSNTTSNNYYDPNLWKSRSCSHHHHHPNTNHHTTTAATTTILKHNNNINNNMIITNKIFGIVIDAWSKSNNLQAPYKAQNLFHFMKNQFQQQNHNHTMQSPISSVIYSSLMWCWIRSAKHRKRRRRKRDTNHHHHHTTTTTTAAAISKDDDDDYDNIMLHHVEQLYQEMKHSYNIKIQQGDWYGAMLMKPTDQVYNALLSAYSYSSQSSNNQDCKQSLYRAMNIFEEISNPNNSSSSSSQHHYQQQQQQQESYYDHDISIPNLQHYTTMMNVCSKHNRPDLAEQYFQKLKQKIQKLNKSNSNNTNNYSYLTNNNHREHRLTNHLSNDGAVMGDLDAVYRTRVEAWAQAGDPEMTKHSLEEWMKDYNDYITSSSMSSFIRLQNQPELPEWSAILRAWLRSNRQNAGEMAEMELRQLFNLPQQQQQQRYQQHLSLSSSSPVSLQQKKQKQHQQSQQPSLATLYCQEEHEKQSLQQQQQEQITYPVSQSTNKKKETTDVVLSPQGGRFDPNARCFDTVISAYAKSNSSQAGENALRLLKELKQLKAIVSAMNNNNDDNNNKAADMEQLQPTLVTYAGVIVALCRSSCHHHPQQEQQQQQQDSLCQNLNHSQEIEILLQELMNQNDLFWSIVHHTPEELFQMMKHAIQSSSSLLPNKDILLTKLSKIEQKHYYLQRRSNFLPQNKYN